MFPLASNIHHITIAVHGDKPRSITPAMYCGFPARRTLAYTVIMIGATTQLANKVTRRGLGLREAIFTSLNRIPKTVGYIMKNRSTLIGMDRLANFRESMNSPNAGRNLPTSKPITMQIAIHSVKYFSHSPRESSSFTCFACSSSVSTFSRSLLLANHFVHCLLGKGTSQLRSHIIDNLVYFGERYGVEPLVALFPINNQSGILENFQMPGNDWLNKVQMRHYFANAFFSVTNKFENFNPGGVGERIKNSGF